MVDSANGEAAEASKEDVQIVVDNALAEGTADDFVPSHGLTSAEAAKLLEEHGRNELPEKITPSWLVFLQQFKAPLPIMLWCAPPHLPPIGVPAALRWDTQHAMARCRLAIIIELAIENWIDAAILFAIQMTNATIGWYETQKSGNAVAALKASLKPEATVKRDGKFVNMDAALVVPGDCVLLASGSAVPADCIVNDGLIEVDQAALTGACLPYARPHDACAAGG